MTENKREQAGGFADTRQMCPEQTLAQGEKVNGSAGSIPKRLSGGHEERNGKKFEQILTYQHIPEDLKHKTVEILKQPGETLKQKADIVGEDRSEEYNRMEIKVRDIQQIGHTLNTENRRTDIVNALQKESNKYIAGDMFFRDGNSAGAVSAYISAAKETGVYGGYTIGVHKAFMDVCAHPEDYMKKRSLTLDEDKVMAKIRKSERYKAGLDGKMVMKGEISVFDIPQNNVWRKKADSAFKYREINDLEIKMKKFFRCGIYTPAEEKMLSENNRIFRFSSLSDIENTGRIVDKYLLEQIKIAGASEGNILQIGVKRIFGRDLKTVDLKMLRKMRSRDIRKLLQEVQGKAGSEAIVEALKAREMITGSTEKIRKLGNIQNIGKTGLMVLGGDELLQSDLGHSISYVRTVGRTGEAAVKAGKAAVDLTGKAAVNVADYVMPNQMDAYRQWRVEKAKAKAAQMKWHVEYIQNLKPVRMIKGVSQGIRKEIETVSEAYSNTLVGHITGTIKKYGGRGLKTVGNMVRKPFVAAGQAIDFVKKKILLPGALVLGFLFIAMYIIASMGGGSGGISTFVLTAILAEPVQFADYQAKYDACDAVFQNQVSNIVNGFAKTTNLKGKRIYYGINTPGLSSGDIQTQTEYKNGVTLHYFYDGSATEGISSNIEDCLSAMTVIMSQAQSEHHVEALELLEAIYKSTHSYMTTESALYPCTAGCEVSHYFCNEWDNHYPSTDLRFSPWLYAELTVPSENHMCEVCRADADMTPDLYSGCAAVSVCYHNEGTDSDNFGGSRPSRSKCSNPDAYWDCDHECDNEDCSHDCSDRPTGCAGYWYCGGHDHYGCPEGHDVAACYGHVDLDMSIYIASLNRIFEMGGIPVIEDPIAYRVRGAETEADTGREGGDGG